MNNAKGNQNLMRSAAQAIPHYCNMLDPNKHNITYFFVKLDKDESYAFHSEWDFGDACGRYLDSLISCRLITGDESGRESEEKLKDALRWMFCKDDGLSYRMEDNEWVKPTANIFDQRSVLLGLLSWYFEKGEQEPYDLIKKLIRGLINIGVERDNYICFPFQNYFPGIEYPGEIFNEHGFIVDPAHYGGGVLILPLAVFYERTKDEVALYLLEKLTNFIVYHSMMCAEDGSFYSKERYPDDGHFHSKMGTVAGIIRYAICIGDSELLKWADRVYLWARSMGGSNGWFPEGVGLNWTDSNSSTPHSEICCTTDMIHCALYLSKCGFRDYWDHAESYLNFLLVAQINDVSWAKEITDRSDTDQYAYKNIPRRYKGAFTGRAQPNDLTNFGKIDTMACCCAAGTRGLYLLWNNVFDLKEDAVFVNLFINKETSEIDIYSYIPDEGKLELHIKKEMSLFVRIPKWLDISRTKIKKNGQPFYFSQEENYIDLEKLNKGDKITIEFPLFERVISEVIAENEYKMTWKGSRIVMIDPVGLYMPFYR